MVATVLSLAAVALLAGLLVSTTLRGGGSGNAGVSNAPGVSQADAVTAQQSLTNALSAVQTAAATAGGYGAIDAATLSSSDPGLSFVDGPTSSASTVSVASDQGASGGTVTLAVRSSNHVCWLIWKGGGDATWYGAQTGASSCTAPALPSPPIAGPVASSSIGWQLGGFPSA